MDLRGQGQKAVDEVNNAINLSCAGLAASTLITVITVPLTGVACGTALVVSTPIGLIEGFKGSKLLTSEELTTFERILNIGAGTLVIAGTAGRVFLSVGKNAKTAAASIALFSDGTAAGERELANAGGVLKGALKSFSNVNLLKQEVGDVHVVSTHIGKDSKYLLDRIARNESKTPTTFFSLDVAEKEINKAISSNYSTVLEWLKSAPEGSLTQRGWLLDGLETGESLGYGFVQNINGSVSRVDNIKTITVVLKKVSTQPNGFVVYTAYPLIK
jgi:hypothetical protein